MILSDLVIHRVVEKVGPVGVSLHEAPVKQFLQTQPQHCCPNLHAKEVLVSCVIPCAIQVLVSCVIPCAKESFSFLHNPLCNTRPLFETE